jgi:hypothetical protein
VKWQMQQTIDPVKRSVRRGSLSMKGRMAPVVTRKMTLGI